MKKLMMIDGNSILNRAYYGIRTLSTRDGLYTNGIYGFLTTYLRLLDEETPDAVCVAFDLHAPTFRHQADERYKATRKPMPDELRMQVPVLKETLDALRIPRCELEGWEADDLLGTMARRCEAEGWECVLVTGDKDSLQLITEHTKVKLVSTRMGRTTTRDMTPETFRETYGFEPIHMIDLKALMGDASDNISGVRGIGEKTAMALVQMYNSIDHLYSHMPDICMAPGTPAKPHIVKKLAEGEADARHSHWLATIVTDAPLTLRLDDLCLQKPGPEAYPLFLKLEFSRLIEQFGLSEAETTAETPSYTSTVDCVASPDRAGELLTIWRQAAYVSVTALPDLSVLAVACETGPNASLMADLRFSQYQGDWNSLLRSLFSDDIRKIAHNVKDLMRTLLENGLPAEGFVFDTALAAYLLDATAGSYDLNRLFVSYYNEELPKPVYLEPGAFSPLEDHDGLSAAALYSHTAALDALYHTLSEKLRERNQWELFQTEELPLCRVLAEMEQTGCRVDAQALSAFGTLLAQRIQSLEQSIYDMAGCTFNINSPKQLGEILFDQMRLPHGKKTKTGWSTSVEVLEKLRYTSPIVDAVLTYRQYSKLKSTYADGLLKAIGRDGRVRTSFQMTVTATGRLSSTEPNLQNIPTRTDLGSEIRKMFIPDPGCVLVDADYSQIELRLLAHVSGDQAMQAAFLAGDDFHQATAARVFGVDPSMVTADMRRHAKAVNFGIVYGISAFSLAQDLGMSVAEAKAYMNAYFTAFPGVRRYMTDIVERAKADGYVETLFHRRRDLPELAASKRTMRAFGERVALNMPIQGAAADVMKLAMAAVWKRLRAEGLQARLVLQVHDELIVECPEAEAETVAALLEEEMESVVSLSVPLTAEAHWGRNWLEAKA